MEKNVLLVYPRKFGSIIANSCDISLALLYLSGAIRDICDNVYIFDFNTHNQDSCTEELLQMIERNNINVAGINCFYSALFPEVRKIAQTVKKHFPNIKIVTGGMHPTLYAKEIIDKEPSIDAVVIGEGEESFRDLLKLWFGETSITLYGVAMKEAQEIVERNHYIEDLDKLHFPGYEFFNLADYETDTANYYSPDGYKISKVQMPILTSRGCPYSCNFCSMYKVTGKGVRFKSAEAVFYELSFLYNEYGINYFRIMDDNFTCNRERAVSICKMVIDSGMKCYFSAINGLSPRTLDFELLELMRKAGFITLSIAAESGSEYIRNQVMGKHTSNQQIIDAFKWCKQLGILAAAYFVVGMPEETAETLGETEQLLHEIDVSKISLFQATPFSGTRLYEQCQRDNLFTTPEVASWEGYIPRFHKEGTGYYGNDIRRVYKRDFRIKPYKLSVEELQEHDMRLQQVAYQKSAKWRKHLEERQ